MVKPELQENHFDDYMEDRFELGETWGKEANSKVIAIV